MGLPTRLTMGLGKAGRVSHLSSVGYLILDPKGHREFFKTLCISVFPLCLSVSLLFRSGLSRLGYTGELQSKKRIEATPKLP